MPGSLTYINHVTETVLEAPVLASPNVNAHHSHAAGVCPLRSDHSYCPPQPNDKRSPCPGLNTLANHGFLPRDGNQIDPFAIFRALREGYQVSTFLAFFLAFVGWFVLGQFRKVSLWDFARHDCIEHDASLFHVNVQNEDEYAPTASNSLIKSVLHQGGRYHSGYLTLEDVANIRIKREAELARPLGWLQAEIARSEMTIAIGVLGGKSTDKDGLDLEVLRLWVAQERLPDGWKPNHTQGQG